MVKWKNIDLRTKGIIVEKIPNNIKAKKKIEIIEVEGRNGFLSIDSGTYESFPLTLECHCTDDVNLDELKSFLDGFGTLSFDDTRQYTAIIDNSIPFETILPFFKKFQISFIVNPIAEDINETTANLYGENEIEIETYATVYPILEITCSGDISITINNKTFYLYDTADTYTLDCKNKIITDSNGVNKSGIMSGDFPIFINGENTISTTGTITAFSCKYRKTYL